MVQERLQRVLPPKNIAEAKALAGAGDLVVPFISVVSEMKVNEAAACVIALAEIGTGRALVAAQIAVNQL